MTEVVYNFDDVQDLILKKAIPYAASIRFDSSINFEFQVATLYSSALELGWACLVLIEKRIGYYSWTTLRSFLEVYVEVKNLINDEKYLLNRELSDEKQLHLQMRHAKQGNPYFKLIAENHKLDAKIEAHRERIQELERSGAEKLTVERKFQIANESEVYDGLYRMLSKHVHPTKSGLRARHVDFEQEPPKLKAMDHGDAENFHMVTHSLFELIVGLSKIVHFHFQTGLEEEFQLKAADTR